MKTLTRIAVMLGVLAMLPAAYAKENLTEIDASSGKSKGHWVIFISKAMAPNAPMGTCVAGVGEGDELDVAFGMYIESARPTVGKVGKDVIKEARESEDEPAATTTIVKVTPEQYKEVKAIVDEYAAKEDFENRAIDVVMNMAQPILDALGMKRPYRSGLGAANAVVYYADIAVLNRNLGKEDT